MYNFNFKAHIVKMIHQSLMLEKHRPKLHSQKFCDGVVLSDWSQAMTRWLGLMHSFMHPASHQMLCVLPGNITKWLQPRALIGAGLFRGLVTQFFSSLTSARCSHSDEGRGFGYRPSLALGFPATTPEPARTVDGV